MYAKAGYIAVFGMAMALIIIDILMRLCMIEKKTAAKYTSLKSVAPQNGFYGTFTTAVSQEQEHEHEQRQEQEHPVNDTGNNVQHDEPQDRLLEGGAHDSSDKKQSHVPTIFLLLSIPRLLAAIYCIFVNVSILCAFDGVLPLYLKRLFHWNSLGAGTILLCLAIPALTGPLVGKLSDRFGPRWIAVAGCSLSAPPLILLRLVRHDSLEQKILLGALLTCCGKLHHSLFVSTLMSIYPQSSSLNPFLLLKPTSTIPFLSHPHEIGMQKD